MTPTTAAWAGLAAYVACVDMWLIRRGHPTMSTFARRHRAATAALAAALTAHLLTSSRWDPLHLIGDALQPVGR